MFTIPWDVKEPTHYSKRVGCEVPGVVAGLCESIAGPHQLIAAKKLNLLNQIKERKKKNGRLLIFSIEKNKLQIKTLWPVSRSQALSSLPPLAVG